MYQAVSKGSIQDLSILGYPVLKIRKKLHLQKRERFL